MFSLKKYQETKYGITNPRVIVVRLTYAAKVW